MEQEEIEYQNQQALEEERMNQEAAENAAQMQAVAQVAAAEEKQKEPIIQPLSDMPYFFAVVFAFMKDIVDFLGATIEPLTGTVITLMVLSLMSMMVFLAKPSDFFGNFRILFGGTVVEEIPGINLLPAYTAATVWIYVKVILKRIEKNKPRSSKIAKYEVKYATK